MTCTYLQVTWPAPTCLPACSLIQSHDCHQLLAAFFLGGKGQQLVVWKCWSCSPHVLSQPCFVLSETLTWSNFLCYKTPPSLFWSSITTRKSERNFQKNQRERREKIWKKTIRKIQRKFWREIWEWTTLPNPLVPWISDWGVWKN